MKKRKKYTKVKRKSKVKKRLLNDGGYIYDENKSEFANMVAQNAHLSSLQNEALGDQATSVIDGINSEMENEGLSAGKGALSGASTGMSVAGPWGALAGGIIGAGAGLLTSSRRNVQKFNATADVKDAKRLQEKEIDESNKEFQKDAYANILEDYNKKGNKNIAYFANGGDLNNGKQVYAGRGGNLKELANDVDIIEGKTHKEGGVDLKSNGEVIAEGEDKEVIKDDNMVFSDKLGYAKIAEKIAKKKAKFEKDLNSTDRHKRNTAIRMTENLDKELNSLFAKQEINKNNSDNDSNKILSNGGELGSKPVSLAGASSATNSLLQASTLFSDINNSKRAKLEYDLANPTNDRFSDYEYPSIDIDKMDFELQELDVPEIVNPSREINRRETMKLADGGKLLQGAQFAVPLIENVVNSNIIKKTPQLTRHEILKPELLTAEELETDIDINPQLAHIDNRTKAFNTAIDRGTNNANVGRANKIAAHISNIEQTNKLRSDKANLETELRNKNKLNKQQIRNVNTNAINTYAKINSDNKYNDEMLEFQRKDEIAGRKSQNIANLTEDLMKGIEAAGQSKLDKEKIWTNLQSYDSGVQANMLNDENFVNNYLKGDKNKQNQFKEMIKGRPDAVIQYNKMFPNNLLITDDVKSNLSKINYNSINKGIESMKGYSNIPK